MFLIEEGSTYRISDRDRDAIVRIEPPCVMENGEEYEIALIKSGNGVWQYQGILDQVTVTVEQKSTGLFYIQRTWTNLSDKSRRIKTVFRITACFDVQHYLIPCVNINGNEYGRGKEPKGLTYKGEKWVFAYDRVSIPSCTLTENRTHALSLFASSESDISLVSSCSIWKDDDGTFHQEILHPAFESPVTYIDRDKYGEATDNRITLNAGDISGTKYVGGIMGHANIPVANKISVENVMNEGDITATGGVLGGISGGALTGGKDILFQNVYTSGNVTGTGAATYEGVHIGAWRYILADGNLFYLDNGNANLNTNGDAIAVTAETVLVKETFASLLEDSAWIYVNGNGPELKVFHVHTEEILSAVAPTYTSTGLTEGKKCSACGEILVAQKEIPKLTLKGDMDGNGTVSVADVIVVIKAVLNDTPLENGDLNDDGKVGLADVIRVMKLIAQ